VRGYIAVGLSENEHGGDVNASTSFSANRAFIQWAGFTFGRAQSFFDFYSNPATSYWGAFPGSDTGDGGWFVMGYTAQFGNGLSGSIAVEAPRKTGIADGLGAIVGGAFVPAVTGIPGNNYGGFQAPDVVANLRLDQAWGSAQIMGALHDVNATYYSGVGASAASLASGHPDDEVGWVIGGGIKVNAPFFGVGDYFQAQVNYTQGALRYVFQTSQPSWSINDTGNSAGYGVITDAVYNGLITSSGAGAATSLELTTAWNINAAYEHFWNPRWRTSLYGGYAGHLQLQRQQHSLRLWHQWRCHQWLRQRLADLVDRFAHPVEHHQGFLHGRGCDVFQAAKRDDCSQSDPRRPRGIAEPRIYTADRSGQLVVPLPRAPRFLSLIV
jgi:hypothetical protein